MNRINDYVHALQAEWTASQQWADLSCFDRVDADKLRPATDQANKLYDEMAAQLREEKARLQTLREVHQDAEHLNDLIQNQVSHIRMGRGLVT